MKTQLAHAKSANAPQLIWHTPALAGRSTELTQKLVIGRDPDCSDILIEDDLVSRQHASIEVDASGRVILTDLRSTNGTFVNSEEITQRELWDGDRIGFGSSERSACAFRAAPPAVEASPGGISEIDITESPTALISSDMKLCPRCKRRIASESGECRHCAAGVAVNGAAAGSGAPEPSIFCRACGAGADVAAAFCRRCGASLAKKATTG